MRARHLLSAALLFGSLPLIARADVTYTYTGNPFTYFDGSVYAPGDYVHGSFTFDTPSEPNIDPGFTTYLDTDLVDYSVTDGVYTYNPANNDGESGLLMEVDARGNVVLWTFFLDSAAGYTAVSNNTEPYPYFFAEDFGELNAPNATPPVFSFGEVDNNPGTWSGPNPTTPTPEPSTLVMICTGMMGAGGVLRRRGSLKRV